MGDRLQLNDEVLTEAAVSLVTASQAMVEKNASRPAGHWTSLTGIGDAVDLHLRGLAVARAALADAAKTASTAVADVMSESAEVDEFIASSLYSGFAVNGGRK